MEVIVGSTGAVGFHVPPIQMMVVNECPIHQHAMMRSQRAGDDIGGIGGGASILRRPGATFGIGFDYEAAEVRDAFVNRVGGLLPPRGNVRIERIKSLQAADGHGAAHVHRHRQPHSPWAKSIGNAHQLRKKFGTENVRIGVDVVDRASIDADGREQPGIFADAGEIGGDLSIIEKNRASGVTALDRAIEVVPLADPTDGRGRRLGIVERAHVLLLCDSREKRKCSVEHAAVAGADDQPVLRFLVADGLEPEAVAGKGLGAFQFREEGTDVVPGAEHERVGTVDFRS